MKQFDKIDMNKMRKIIIEKYNQPYSISLCHYVILNNEVKNNFKSDSQYFFMFNLRKFQDLQNVLW